MYEFLNKDYNIKFDHQNLIRNIRPSLNECEHLDVLDFTRIYDSAFHFLCSRLK